MSMVNLLRKKSGKQSIQSSLLKDLNKNLTKEEIVAKDTTKHWKNKLKQTLKIERHTYLSDGRVNMVKMAMIPKAI